MNQRIFPYNQFNFKVFKQAKLHAAALRRSSPFREDFKWEFVGPTNIGGRISDVEVDPKNKDIVYYAASSGGIFKSTDGGKTFKPIFDDQITLNTGDL